MAVRSAALRIAWLPLLLLALLPSSSAASGADWTSKLRTLNIAHQGGEDEAPSNTMYAYDRALRLGADMLEVDVHTSADGALVVLHDATVDRTTNGSGRVYDLTLEQIQALDAGHNFIPGEGTESDRPPSEYVFRGVRTGERKPPPGFRPRDFRIPTLDEVMREYPDVPINIEIKGAADTDVASFQRNAEALAAFLNGLGRSDGIVVASFNDTAVQRFHELAPQIDIAPATVAVAGYTLTGLQPPAGSAVFQVPMQFSGITVADEAFVERAHADGYGVHVWTINDEPTMRQLLDWDVDGIMSAEPIRLEQVLCRVGAERPERPASAPGAHCNKRASIACQVEPRRATRRGNHLRVVLLRSDEFAGRCAGRLAVSPVGSRARQVARFNFGKLPPSEGGRGRLAVKLELRGKVHRAARSSDAAIFRTQPYGAFLERRTLRMK